MACAVMCSHLQLLLQPFSPGLGLLQGFAAHLSIAHKHIIHCNCLLEDTWQYLIQFCQHTEGTDKLN